MDYYDYNRARAIANYSQIDEFKQEIEFLSEKVHRIRTRNLMRELKANESIRLKSKQLSNLEKQKYESIDAIKDLASKVIISNLKIYSAKNQSIHITIYTNSAFRDTNFFKKNAKPNKILKRLFKESAEFENENIIYLKANINKLIPKFFKKWNDFKNNKLIALIKKENENIRNIEDKIISKNNSLEKKVNRIKVLETSIFKSKEYLKLNMRREMNRNTFWDIEIKSAVRKYTYIQASYLSAVEIINLEYGHIFENNKASEMCPICLEEDKRYIKTNCGHYFHVECICIHIHGLLTSANIEIKCPMCRQIMV